MSSFAGPLLILLCTVVWGSAFVAQKLGADHFGPFAISCYRNLLAGFFIDSNHFKSAVIEFSHNFTF